MQTSPNIYFTHLGDEAHEQFRATLLKENSPLFWKWQNEPTELSTTEFSQLKMIAQQCSQSAPVTKPLKLSTLQLRFLDEATRHLKEIQPGEVLDKVLEKISVLTSKPYYDEPPVLELGFEEFCIAEEAINSLQHTELTQVEDLALYVLYKKICKCIANQ